VNLIHRRGAEESEFPQRDVTERVIAAAMEVHSVLGPGLLESVYHHALARELSLRGVPFASQVAVPVRYKDFSIEPALRVDLVVADAVIVEIKSVAALEEIHRAQLLTYLRLSGLQAGLLINFNTTALRQGLKRVVNSLRTSAPSAPLR
jgi:GxxExxY protein